MPEPKRSISGLIVIGEEICDGCKRKLKHGERYACISREGQQPERFCEECSRARGYLKWVKDSKGHWIEIFG